jgi:tetratricopeptide (TPR) repeat protein
MKSPPCTSRLLALALAAFALLGSETGAWAAVDSAPKGKSLKLYELVHAGDLLVASGQLDRAIEFYNEFRFNFASDVVFWRRFARLYEQKGDLERALGCLDHLPQLGNEGTELGDVIRQAELLWRLGRPQAALTRLVGSKEQANPEDSRFWNLLYDLAWNQEQDFLALEALRKLWSAERDPSVALNLLQLLYRTSNYDEASELVIASLAGPPRPTLLLEGVKFALEGRRWTAARSMIERAEKRAGYSRHAEFFLARGLLALETERAREAERDFERSVAIDPEAGGCVAWLQAGILTEDVAIAHRALGRCKDREQRRPVSWDLLADVYRIVGQAAQASAFRAMARERTSWPEPREYPRDTSPTEIELQEAVDRGDTPSITRLLADAGAVIGVATRINALETLGRMDEAWALLEQGGYARSETAPRSSEEALLLRRAHWLKEEHLSGAWLTSEASNVGSLGLYGLRLRAEQRWRHLYFGLEASQSRSTSTQAGLLADGRDEIGVGLTLRRRWGKDDSRLGAGARFVPTGWMPQAQASHATTWFDARLRAEAVGFVGRLPMATGALRTSALIDGAEATASWQFPTHTEIRAAVEASRLAARDRSLIGYQAQGIAEAAQPMTWALGTVRPRVYLEYNHRHNEPYLPTSILPAILRGAEPEGFWLDGYSAAGIGLGFGNALGQELDGKGPRLSLRYGLQASTSYVWPSRTVGLGLEAALATVIARHQEVGASGFFYSGIDRRIGERNSGLSLTYVARWF